MPRFDDLEFHPNFEQHQVDAGRRLVTPAEVEAVWYGIRTFVRSRRPHRSYLMKGLTSAGRQITVVVRPTRESDTWQIYSAWDTKHTD
jgi:hypothetical protein